MARCSCREKKLKNISNKMLSKSKALSNDLHIKNLSQTSFTRTHKNKAARAPRRVRRASFTIEAAFILPVFVFAGAMLLGLFSVISAQIQVGQGLVYAARQTAAAIVSEYVSSDTETRAYFDEQMSGAELYGLSGAVSLDFSESDEEYLSVIASYTVSMPVSFFGFSEIDIAQCVSCRKWIGDTADGIFDKLGDSESVYVTATGSAYHSTRGCPYLDLSIRRVASSSLGTTRNKSGGKYYACSCFVSGTGSAYITDYGTEYHSRLTCSNLKRTISTMEKDTAIAAGYHACAKCVGE